MARLAYATLVTSIFTLRASADDWPDFRGPTGQGHYTGKTLPLDWSAAKNIAWKQPIPGRGWSSPIIYRDRIYLTTAVPIQGSKDQSLKALCLNAADGNVLWQTEVFRQDAATAPGIHSKNSHASPSPVTEGKFLYVHFGHQGTACLSLDGAVRWRNTELRYAPVHGAGGTPIVVDDKLVFSTDGSDKQFLVALNCVTGDVVWKTDRKCEFYKKFSFSTPLLIEAQGKRQIVSPTSGAVISYDPKTGQELWRAKYDGYSLVPRPVFGHGMIFLSTGYDSPNVLAIRVDGTGDVTDSHIVWTLTRGAPHTPSPLLVGDELYLISDHGIASCVGARTGKVHWQERVGDDNAYAASPLYAHGRIYLQSEDGTTTVLKAGKQFEQLAQSELNERTFASFAAADGAIYLRSDKHLYGIRAK